jgi:AraC-like DNA-binding protein
MKQIINLPSDVDGRVRRVGNQGHIAEMHRHDELEVSLVTRGRAVFLLLDRRYDLRRGAQTWLFPAQEHVIYDQSPDYEMWVCQFSPRLVRRVCTTEQYRMLAERNPPGHWCKRLPLPSIERFEALFTEVRSARRDVPRYNAGLAYILLSSWMAHLEAPEITGQQIHASVESAVRLIRTESEPLSLTELSRRVRLSPARLSTLFKQQMGLPLAIYRQQCQLERFLKSYASEERRSMLEVALDAGFGSYAQFYRVFRRLMGYGPARYRRELARRGEGEAKPERAR